MLFFQSYFEYYRSCKDLIASCAVHQSYFEYYRSCKDLIASCAVHQSYFERSRTLAIELRFAHEYGTLTTFGMAMDASATKLNSLENPIQTNSSNVANSLSYTIEPATDSPQTKNAGKTVNSPSKTAGLSSVNVTESPYKVNNLSASLSSSLNIAELSGGDALLTIQNRVQHEISSKANTTNFFHNDGSGDYSRLELKNSADYGNLNKTNALKNESAILHEDNNFQNQSIGPKMNNNASENVITSVQAHDSLANRAATVIQASNKLHAKFALFPILLPL